MPRYSYGPAPPSRIRSFLPSAAAFIVAASIGMLMVGCSAKGGDSPPVAEAYPGVISPMDVTPRESTLEGRALARLPAQQKVEHLAGKYGASSVVALVVEGFPAEKAQLLHQRVSRAASPVEAHSRPDGDRTICYLGPVDDMEAFVGKLDLGEATIDAAKRVVFIQADPAKL